MNDGENIVYAATDTEGDSFAVLNRDGYTHELALHATYKGNSAYVVIENPGALHTALGQWLTARDAEAEHLAATWGDALRRLAGSILKVDGEYTEVCSVCDRKHVGPCSEDLDVCSCGHTRSTHRSESGGCIRGRNVCLCPGFTTGVLDVPEAVPEHTDVLKTVTFAGTEWRTECGWCGRFVAADKLVEHKREVCVDRTADGLPSTCPGCGHVEHGNTWCGGTQHCKSVDIPGGTATRRCKCGEPS